MSVDPTLQKSIYERIQRFHEMIDAHAYGPAAALGEELAKDIARFPELHDAIGAQFEEEYRFVIARLHPPLGEDDEIEENLEQIEVEAENIPLSAPNVEDRANLLSESASTPTPLSTEPELKTMPSTAPSEGRTSDSGVSLPPTDSAPFSPSLDHSIAKWAREGWLGMCVVLGCLQFLFGEHHPVFVILLLYLGQAVCVAMLFRVSRSMWEAQDTPIPSTLSTPEKVTLEARALALLSPPQSEVPVKSPEFPKNFDSSDIAEDSEDSDQIDFDLGEIIPVTADSPRPPPKSIPFWDQTLADFIGS
jgi:hypothetical protein